MNELLVILNPPHIFPRQWMKRLHRSKRDTPWLAYSVHLRIYLEPEYCHPAWNNLKSAIRVSGLQPAFLKATLMSHVNHSPYQSGANMHLKREVCESIVESMTIDDFQRLCEDMAWDRGFAADDDSSVPSSPEALLSPEYYYSEGCELQSCFSHCPDMSTPLENATQHTPLVFFHAPCISPSSLVQTRLEAGRQSDS